MIYLHVINLRLRMLDVSFEEHILMLKILNLFRIITKKNVCNYVHELCRLPALHETFLKHVLRNKTDKKKYS